MQRWEERDRWALVTGASSGIGEAFARALAARGMNVVLSARREERLRTIARELEFAHRVRTAVVAADLGEPGAAEHLWTEATAHGRTIHLLVNNAGFGLHGRFDDLPLERQEQLVQLNCTAVLGLARLALPGMRERGEGGIINVASVVAFQPVPRMAAYAASKAFVLGLSLALREENRDRGIRVLALCPGGTRTEFQQRAGTVLPADALGVRSAEQVVAAALRALENGRGYVVPGAPNRLSAILARLLPLPLVTRVAGMVLERMR